MRHFLLSGSGLLLGLLRVLPGAGQALDPTFVTPTALYSTAAVDAMGPAQADGKRLVAVYATRVNGAANGSGLLRLDATGAIDQAFSQNVGLASEPYRMIGLANGQYLLEALGDGLTAGGLTRAEVLRLNADGTGDASFNPGTGPSGDLTNPNGFGYSEVVAAQPDGKVLVGGYFDSYSGQVAHSLVRLTASGSVDNTFSVGAGIPTSGSYNEVLALAVQADGKILVGGLFQTFNGQPAYALVRLNANGSRDPSFTSPLSSNDHVYSLAVQPDGSILATGLLTQNGQATRLVRLLPAGGFDPSFTPSQVVTNGITTSFQEPALVLQADGKLVVVGDFDVPGYRRVARLNADGTLDVSFNSPVGPNQIPATVGVQPDGSILVGGQFGVGSLEASVARFASSGALDASYTPKFQNGGSVTLLARLPDGSLLASGDFTEWDGQPAHRVAHLSSTGVFDAAYAAASTPLPSTAVTALLAQADGKAVIGTYNGLYRWLPSGAPDTGFSFTAGTYTSVTALAQQPDGKLLVAGNLYNPAGAGSAYSRLVRLTTGGTFDPSFAATTSSVGNLAAPSALLVQADGRILLAANASATTSSTPSYLQRYETNGATDASFTVQPFAYLTSSGTTGQARIAGLSQQADGRLLVAGRFTRINGATVPNHLARLSTTGAVDASFTPGTLLGNTNLAQGMVVQPNGRILVHGAFSVGSASGTYNNLLRVLNTGQLDASFTNAANPNGQVRTVIVQPDGGILLQGAFTQVAGQARRNLARITAPNVLAVAAPAAVAAATSAWPVPARERLHVLPAPTAHPLAAELLDALGRVVLSRTLTSTAEFTLDTQAMPAGFYVLRLRYAEGTVSRHLSVE